MWAHWRGGNSWQVDAAVLPTNVSIPGFLSVCCWSVTFLAGPVQSQPSPVSPLTCFFQFWPVAFFFQFWPVGPCPRSLSLHSANLSPLLGRFSPSQGCFSPLKVVPPPPQGSKFRSPPPLAVRFFSPLTRIFFSLTTSFSPAAWLLCPINTSMLSPAWASE